MWINLSRVPSELLAKGALIRVLLSHSHTDQEVVKQCGESLPSPSSTMAMIDTGAAYSLVDPKIAKTLKLQPRDVPRVIFAGEEHRREEYVINIEFPGNKDHLKPFLDVRVVNRPIEPGVGCLLGRNVLARWEIMYNGRTGEVRIREA